MNGMGNEWATELYQIEAPLYFNINDWFDSLEMNREFAVAPETMLVEGRLVLMYTSSDSIVIQFQSMYYTSPIHHLPGWMKIV